MTKVTAQMSVSLDGCYTGPRDTRDPKDMSGWMQGPEAPGFFRVTRWVVDAMAWRERLGFAGGERSVNSEIIEETFAAAGAHESEPTARSRHAPTRNPRRSPVSDGGEVPYRPKAAQLAVGDSCRQAEWSAKPWARMATEFGWPRPRVATGGWRRPSLSPR